MMFPPEFEVHAYRRLNRDLLSLSDDAARRHYDDFGRAEGRMANDLTDRASFGRLVLPTMSTLEIGPFASPFVRGPNVRYCDMFDTEELRRRAAAAGLDPAAVPDISYVLDSVGMQGVGDDFDAVVSSHCIEHQPDLIAHLQQVRRLLAKRGGSYFALVPDKRYCFDRCIPESTIADVVDAHERASTRHSLRNLIAYRALATHNEPGRHWNEPAAADVEISPHAVACAVREWRAAGGEYLDVHAWFFTPDSFASIMRLLQELDYVDMTIDRLYPTRHGQNEFWVILRSAGADGRR